MKRKRNRQIGALAAGSILLLLVAIAAFASRGTAAQQAAPVNTSPPTLSGTAEVGKELTGKRGDWSGNPTDYNFFWTRCDRDGGSCSNISGATRATYTLTTADVGNTVRFKVEAVNADGRTFASSVPSAVVKAAPAQQAAPVNTSPPTLSGTAEVGKQLTGRRGEWSGTPTDFNFFWTRCDRDGANCANISGATRATYTLTSADVGNTVRFKVEAVNAGGRTFASSVPTAVVKAAPAPPPPPPPPPPPAPPSGCAAAAPLQAAKLAAPERLDLSQYTISPSVVGRSTQSITVRFLVTCKGKPVQGALVYAAAVPFNQFTVPAEQPTGADGWAQLTMTRLSGYPAARRQQLLVVFGRARKPGENLLGGISTRRLVSFRVDLRR